MTSEPIDYLSDEWFRLADAALATLPAVADNVTVAVQVLGDHDGPQACYRLVLGPDRVSVINDDKPGDVRLTMPYSVAAAIAQGRVGAQRAFLDGHITLGGDTTALLGHQDQLAEIDDRLVWLRSRTRF
ncbi:MAG: SCP2 sterol-binding domain-containing protein [Acidimicrobiia bacterium]|nr:SCP2 sterol-binding domain-containing protein [Acidimicrobiia bacterium]